MARVAGARPSAGEPWTCPRRPEPCYSVIMNFPFVPRVLRALLPLAALATCTGCGSLTHIDVNAGGKVTVQAGTVVDKLLAGPLDFTGFDKIDFTQDFANQGVGKNDVDSVRLKSLTLSIDAPADGNFDFLQSISFAIEADGAAKADLAHLDAVPKGKNALTLDIPSTELKPYVVAPSMTITGTAKGSLPDQETTISAAAVFDVDVNIL